MKDVILKIRQRHDLPDDADVQVKSLVADMKADQSDPYAFSATITTGAMDRDREVVLPSGMDSREFEKTGTIFWNHDYDKPIGFAGKLGRDGNTIQAAGSRFMKRPDDHTGEFFPDFARAFVTQAKEAGRFAGVSIGFIPLETRLPTEKDRKMFGPDVARVITKWRLLEFSIAPVQANPEAMVTAVGKCIGGAACKALFGVGVEDAEPEKKRATVEIDRSRKVIVVIPRAAKTVQRTSPAKRIDRAARVALARKRGDIYA